ncbi:MAG: hypothetical protein IJ326_12195 [Lachnospiraceae bacterium]|nr:hypothetical protein [Lachnospiraceae bacterium]
MRSKSNDGREIIKLARLSLREIVPIIIIGVAEVVFFGYLLTFIEGNMVDTYHTKTETLIEGNVGIRFMAQVLFAPIVHHMAFNFMGAFHNMQILDEVSKGILCVVGLVCVVGDMIYLYFVLNKKNKDKEYTVRDKKNSFHDINLAIRFT